MHPEAVQDLDMFQDFEGKSSRGSGIALTMLQSIDGVMGSGASGYVNCTYVHVPLKLTG